MTNLKLILQEVLPMSEIFTNIPEIRYEGPDSKNAFGLLKAAAIIEDGRIESFVEKKYESFNS